jgi:hypothetical protein
MNYSYEELVGWKLEYRPNKVKMQAGKQGSKQASK